MRKVKSLSQKNDPVNFYTKSLMYSTFFDIWNRIVSFKLFDSKILNVFVQHNGQKFFKVDLAIMVLVEFVDHSLQLVI